MINKTQQDKKININTICNEIDNCINEFLVINNIDNDYKSLVNIKHQTINYMLSYIYEQLFKPNHNLKNNQKSIIDYDDLELLQVLANKFINICQRFNKSLGLMSFSYFVGIDYTTLYNWLNEKESNYNRFYILKSIQEGHKAAQISLLNDSPVGALAVANNDPETGLEWSKQQAQLTAQSQVFILPSERMSKLKLEKGE